MPPFSLQLRVTQLFEVFANIGNAELIDIQGQRDNAWQLVPADHVLIPNPFGCDDIYDELAAGFRGEPVGTIPAITYGIARQRVTPALLEAVWPVEATKLRLVA